ncbi:putative optic atrophy 3 protein like protein [Cricetulus griseus]|uniref:Putative optic atrophy 3 protein like protein n=1 Tax=Cricetulus griseus TaxID=10029 RepID=A0A061HTA9_CRIGR|nr:putative optic atrophy 3 protein like protein [Cricetulus griseus]
MRTKMRIMGFHAEAIKPLNEEAAAELGSNLLGEAIIFACAGSCLLLEFWRQKNQKHRKEVKHLATLQSLREDVDQLEQALDELQAEPRLRPNGTFQKTINFPTLTNALGHKGAAYGL